MPTLQILCSQNPSTQQYNRRMETRKSPSEDTSMFDITWRNFFCFYYILLLFWTVFIHDTCAKSQLHFISMQCILIAACQQHILLCLLEFEHIWNLSWYRYAGTLFMAYWKGIHQWIWEKMAGCNRPIRRKYNLQHHLSDVWKVIDFPFIFTAVKQGCIVYMNHIIFFWQDSWGSWKLRGSCSLYIWLSMWSSGMFFLFVWLLFKVFFPSKYSH